MQQICLYDDIEILWQEAGKDEYDPSEGSKLNINIKTNKKFLPTDQRNLA
jgi:hypothetical protein